MAEIYGLEFASTVDALRLLISINGLSNARCYYGHICVADRFWLYINNQCLLSCANHLGGDFKGYGVGAWAPKMNYTKEGLHLLTDLTPKKLIVFGSSRKR